MVLVAAGKDCVQLIWIYLCFSSCVGLEDCREIQISHDFWTSFLFISPKLPFANPRMEGLEVLKAIVPLSSQNYLDRDGEFWS